MTRRSQVNKTASAEWKKLNAQQKANYVSLPDFVRKKMRHLMLDLISLNAKRNLYDKVTAKNQKEANMKDMLFSKTACSNQYVTYDEIRTSYPYSDIARFINKFEQHGKLTWETDKYF